LSSRLHWDYDGLAVRSATRRRWLISKAGRLKLIGRSRHGIDNIDLAAATQRGIVVMNTPHGNSVTAADTPSLMMFRACSPDSGRRPLDTGRQMGENPALSG